MNVWMEWMNECLNEWMNVQGGEAEDLPGGDDWRGGVQVRDHLPRHVHLSSHLLVNNSWTRSVTFQINLYQKRFDFLPPSEYNRIVLKQTNRETTYTKKNFCTAKTQ